MGESPTRYMREPIHIISASYQSPRTLEETLGNVPSTTNAGARKGVKLLEFSPHMVPSRLDQGWFELQDSKLCLYLEPISNAIF